MEVAVARSENMAWSKKKIVALVVIAFVGVLVCWVVVCVLLFNLVTNQSSPRPRAEKPFKFAPHRTAAVENPPATNVNSSGLEDFTSNIPVIVLRTDRREYISWSDSYTTLQMEVYEPANGAPARFSNPPSLKAQAGVHVRGMLSRSFPKQSYRLKMMDGSGGERAVALLGMPADADWVLQGPWLDKSLIRNSFSYDLARAMGCAAMRTRPCELFLCTSGRPLSEADYAGVYDLIEHIDRGKEKVSVAKLGPNDNSEPAITGGYILSWDAGDGNYLPSFQPYNGRASLQLRYPKHPTPQQMNWIDRWCSRVDQLSRGPNSSDPSSGYPAYFDVDAWVNYILFEELIFNLDGYERSFYLVKDRDKKIRPGPVWDHDLALGHQLPRGTRFTDWWYARRPRPNAWVLHLMRDPDFRARMAQRWAALRQGVLRDSEIAARIDTYAAPLMTGAADRNFDRWPILNMRIPPHKLRNITIATRTYPEQIAALKEFLRERAAWMDAHLVAGVQL